MVYGPETEKQASGLGNGWEKWPLSETGGEAPTAMVSSLDSSVCSAGWTPLR